MKLLLARHGETDWNAAGHIQGCTDIPLNAKGLAQAEALGRRLKDCGETIMACYASPMARALETARIACAPLGLTPIPAEGLREADFGAWEGRTWDEVEAAWPAAYAAYHADRRSVRPPEGESFGDLLERVLPALRAIAETGEGTVLVVCHSAVIRAVMGALEGLPFSTDILNRYALENASWLTLDGARLSIL